MRLAIIVLLLFCVVPQVQAYCFTFGPVGYGFCSDDPAAVKYPLNWVVVLWLAAVISYGKLLFNPRVHLLVKVVLFFFSFPVSPLLTAILMLLHYVERRLGWHQQAEFKTITNADNASLPYVAPALMQLGEFELDTQTQSLHKNGAVLQLEPKVYQLLAYFFEQQGRVISLEELHQNIWPGQIVTDTAVRRTVSKLRQALDDTNPQQPRFIRSVMKRGYQFLAQ
ncbi:winged helix-turn-helix domain-containing protein [Rheinheimera gaetbuli]